MNFCLLHKQGFLFWERYIRSDYIRTDFDGIMLGITVGMKSYHIYIYTVLAPEFFVVFQALRFKNQPVAPLSFVPTAKVVKALTADLWLMSPPCQPFTRAGKRRPVGPKT